MSGDTTESDQMVNGNGNQIPVHPLKLRRLTDEDLSDVIFDDHLVSTTETGTQTGVYRMSVTVTHSGVRVRASSEGQVANVLCGTRIASLLDRGLETCQEIVSDYLWASQTRLLERRIIIERQESGHDLSWRLETRLRNGDSFMEPLENDGTIWNQRKSGRIQLQPGIKFFGEGANLILLRLIVKRPVCFDMANDGIHQWRALSIDDRGNIRDCIYTSLGSRDSAGFGARKYMNLFGIERMFQRTEILPQKAWETWFDTSGRLQVRIHVNSPLNMRAPGLMISSEDNCLKQSVEDGEPTADRRPSITRTGCLCGMIPGRGLSVRSHR